MIFEIGVFLQLPRLMRRFTIRQILIFSFACAVVRFAVIGWAAEYVLAHRRWRRYSTRRPSVPIMRRRVAACTDSSGAATRPRARRSTPVSRSAPGGTIGGLASGYAWEQLGPAMTFSLGSAAALVGPAPDPLARAARAAEFVPWSGPPGTPGQSIVG